MFLTPCPRITGEWLTQAPRAGAVLRGPDQHLLPFRQSGPLKPPPDRTLYRCANTRSCVGVESLMTVSRCVKVLGPVFIDLFFLLISILNDITGCDFHHKFSPPRVPGIIAGKPHILCPGGAQLLHRLPTGAPFRGGLAGPDFRHFRLTALFLTSRSHRRLARRPRSFVHAAAPVSAAAMSSLESSFPVRTSGNKRCMRHHFQVLNFITAFRKGDLL
jgi:hypothetical protein